MDNKSLFDLYFSQISNITNHYQYLVVLIIGASAYLYRNSKNTIAMILASFSFLLSSLNLVLGLFVYKSILNILFELTESIDKANLADPTLKILLALQLIVGIMSFVILLIAALVNQCKWGYIN